MGIWDDDGFANDDARDWLAHLDPADGLRPVRQLLHAVTAADPAGGDLRQAMQALAAVELVAAAGGRPHPALPEPARRWSREIGTVPDQSDRILATRALDFVGTASSLAELWSERSDGAGWHRELDDLRMRLAAVPDAG